MSESKKRTPAQAWQRAAHLAAHALKMPTGNAEEHLRRQGLTDSDAEQIAAASDDGLDLVTVIKERCNAAQEKLRDATNKPNAGTPRN